MDRKSVLIFLVLCYFKPSLTRIHEGFLNLGVSNSLEDPNEYPKYLQSVADNLQVYAVSLKDISQKINKLSAEKASKDAENETAIAAQTKRPFHHFNDFLAKTLGQTTPVLDVKYEPAFPMQDSSINLKNNTESAPITVRRNLNRRRGPPRRHHRNRLSHNPYSIFMRNKFDPHLLDDTITTTTSSSTTAATSSAPSSRSEFWYGEEQTQSSLSHSESQYSKSKSRASITKDAKMLEYQASLMGLEKQMESEKKQGLEASRSQTKASTVEINPIDAMLSSDISSEFKVDGEKRSIGGFDAKGEAQWMQKVKEFETMDSNPWGYTDGRPPSRNYDFEEDFDEMSKFRPPSSGHQPDVSEGDAISDSYHPRPKSRVYMKSPYEIDTSTKEQKKAHHRRRFHKRVAEYVS